MKSTKNRTRRLDVFGVGAIAALLTVFSALMALVSLALYRTERDEIEGESNSSSAADSN